MAGVLVAPPVGAGSGLVSDCGDRLRASVSGCTSSLTRSGGGSERGEELKEGLDSLWSFADAVKGALRGLWGEGGSST